MMGVGMTWVAPSRACRDAPDSRLRGNDVAGCGNDGGGSGNDGGDASRVRARVFAAFRRILSDSVEGELGHCGLMIADCRLMIGDCKVVSLGCGLVGVAMGLW